jgi:NTP pyrophosphatase (non-canonical NTP hydrolase)
MSIELPEKATLTEMQKYMHQKVIERGFSDQTLPEYFMLLAEEVGELVKAGRKNLKTKKDLNSDFSSVEDEAADVFIYLLEICNVLGVDLEVAFRKKEEKNNKRTWS